MNQYNNDTWINEVMNDMKEIDFELHYSDMFDELTEKYKKKNGQVLDWRNSPMDKYELCLFRDRIGLELYWNQGVEIP